MSSIAEKLKKIAENQQRLYEAGNGGSVDPDKIIKVTATGNRLVSLDDVCEVKHEVKVKVTGKNLFNPDTTLIKQHSITNYDGESVTRFGYAIELPKGVYTLSLVNSLPSPQYVYCAINDKNGNLVRNAVSDTSGNVRTHGYIIAGEANFHPAVITINQGDIFYLYNGADLSLETTIGIFNQLSQIQIEAGTTATSYAPYTETGEGMKVTVGGKNLFNGELERSFYEDVNFKLRNNEGYKQTYRSLKIYLKAGTYTLSASVMLRAAREIKDGEYFSITNTTPYTFTVTTDGYYGVSIRNDDNSDWNDDTRLQIEIGDKATKYEPYKTVTEYIADSNGLVTATSISPNMSIVSDGNMIVEYRKSWGMQAEYDRFWDVYQDYGNRTAYDRAFAGLGWTDETFKPKYKVKIVGSAYMTFANTLITEITRDIVDFSGATACNYTFYYSNFYRNVELDLSSVTKFNDIFDVTHTESIKLYNVQKTTEWTRSFGTAKGPNMTTLIIDGTIGRNGFDVKHLENLSKDSLLSIVNSLEDKSTDTSGTEWVVTLGDINIAKLTDAEKQIAWNKGWVLG